MKIGILYASISGNSESVSLRISRILSQKGVANEVVDLEGKDASILHQYQQVIIVTSTWGAGAVNASLQMFYNSLEKAPIQGKKFLIIGLGDSNYGEYYFCKAVDMLEEKILGYNGELIAPSQKINGQPESIDDAMLTKWISPFETQ